MRNWLLTGITAAAVALSALSGVAEAQSTDNDGCSDATLQGDYAFTVYGEYLGLATAAGPQYFSAPVPINGVGTVNFDGRGNFTQVSVSVLGGLVVPGPTDPETGFGIDQSGTYAVFPDCTGNFVLSLPLASASGKFVLATQGRAIHAVFEQEHVVNGILNCSNSNGCDVLPQYSADGTKLRSNAQHDE
jgi:hypothetical protein